MEGERWDSDWLEAIGFEFFDNSPIHRLERRIRDENFNLIIWLDSDFTLEDPEGGSCYLPTLQTKDQIRQLCGLLGIDLNETVEIGGAS